MDSEHRRPRLLSHRFAGFVFPLALALCVAAALPAARGQTSPVALTVTADHSPVKPGEAVVFTFTVTDVSDDPLPGRGVTVTYHVPNAVEGAAAGTQVTNPYLQVAAHQSFSFHQAFTVDPASAMDGLTVNLTASVYLDKATVASATASASPVIATAPTLSVALEDDAGGSAAPGQSVTYTVTTTNRGTATVANPVLSAPVPAGATFVFADAGGTLAGGAVQWALGPLAPGATILRRFTLQAGSTPGVLPAQATVIDRTDGTHQATSAFVTVVRPAAALGLTVTPDHSPAAPGEVVDYTFTVSNPTAAAFTGRGVNVEWNVPNFVVGATPGQTVFQSYLQVAPGQSFSFHKAYTVGTAPDGSILRLEASAYLSDGNRYGADAAVDVVVANAPALTLGLTDDTAGSAAPGATVTYTLTATNRGGAPLANVSLAAPVPSGTTLVAASADGALSDKELHWPIGVLGAGNYVVRTFSVRAGGGLAGGTILARAEAMAVGNPLVEATAAVATVVPATGLLALKVTADHTTVVPGDRVTYTFTVTNPTAAALTGRGAVVEWSVPNFVTGATPGEVDTNSYLSLAAGASLSFARSYTVAAPPDGSVLRLEASAYLLDGNRYGADAAPQVVVDRARANPAFFNGEVSLGSGVDFLRLPDGNYFGYYEHLSEPNYLYHFDLGFEYVLDAADGKNGVYLYDFTSQTFFYTSPAFPFPYLYDFSLNSVVYYYPRPGNPQRYNTNGYRFFYVFTTGMVIVK